MSTRHPVTTIGGALWRVVAGFSVVEACSLYQGAFGARVDPAAESERRVARADAPGPSSSSPTSSSAGETGGRNRRRRRGGTDAPECAECSAAPFILRQVRNMYLRGVLDDAAFAGSVTFEDPAVSCEGIGEVREAFRAASRFEPRELEPANVTQVADDTYVVRVCLAWTLPVLGETRVPSDVVVTVVTKEKREMLAAARMANDKDGLPAVGVIWRVEERWNGARLLEGFPFDFTRRIAGLVSFAATPALFAKK